MEKLTQKLSGCNVSVAGLKRLCPWRVALEGALMVYGMGSAHWSFCFGKFDPSWSHTEEGNFVEKTPPSDCSIGVF